jgi:hypothetical protein
MMMNEMETQPWDEIMSEDDVIAFLESETEWEVDDEERSMALMEDRLMMMDLL